MKSPMTPCASVEPKRTVAPIRAGFLGDICHSFVLNTMADIDSQTGIGIQREGDSVFAHAQRAEEPTDTPQPLWPSCLDPEPMFKLANGKISSSVPASSTSSSYPDSSSAAASSRTTTATVDGDRADGKSVALHDFKPFAKARSRFARDGGWMKMDSSPQQQQHHQDAVDDMRHVGNQGSDLGKDGGVQQIVQEQSPLEPNAKTNGTLASANGRSKLVGSPTTDDDEVATGGDAGERRGNEPATQGEYRVYKRRWFGLVQLVLLNIIISWDWLTFASISSTSSEYFQVSETAINWLSTGFLFAFVVVSPIVIWTLHLGPKPSIATAAGLTLVGNWIRYGGVRAASHSTRYGVVLFGQILIGFAQPFVLAAPTRYSDMWFTDRGRVAATALASLANPFGGAIGQLVSPILATKASEVADSILYIAIIATVISIPAFFLPSSPPTPPSPSSGLSKPSLQETLPILLKSPSFFLVFVPFAIYVGLFNAISSLINQILSPYNFSEDQAGIAGAILIVAGLITAAVVSVIVDRTHHLLTPIKILVPIVGIMYLAFIFAPGTRDVGAPYAILAFLGAASFSLMPIALEYIVEVTWPASPEVGSVICWTGGQLLGGIFIVVMNALKGAAGEPEGSMKRALILQAVFAMVAVPLPLCLGVERLGLGSGNVKGRLDADGVRREHREGTAATAAAGGEV